jgi:hypothetical protein
MKPKINSQNLFLPGKAFVWRSMEAVGTRQPLELATVPGNMGSAAVLGEGSIPRKAKGVGKARKQRGSNGEGSHSRSGERGFIPCEVHSSS